MPGARARKWSREPPGPGPRAPSPRLRSPPLSGSRVTSPDSETSKDSRKRQSRSRSRSSKAKSKEPSAVTRDSDRSRKRSKENKKKRKHSVSSSSSRSRSRSSSSNSYSSSSSSSSSSNSHSSSSSEGSRRKKSKSSRSGKKKKKRKQHRHSKRPRKERGSKDTKEAKVDLDLGDTPLLQGLDKEILKKITEKIQQSNALAFETKIPKKKKKKEKEASKKKEVLKRIEGEKSSEKQADDKLHKGAVGKGIDKTSKTGEGDENSSSKRKKDKKAATDALTETKKVSEEESGTSVVARMKKEAELRRANVLKEGTDTAQEFRELDIEKAAQKDTTLNIKALMQLPGLEDLQKKLLNYYSKCEVKTTQDSPSGNGKAKSSLEESSKSILAEELSAKSRLLDSFSKTLPQKPSSKQPDADEAVQGKHSKQSVLSSSGREPKSSDKSAASKAAATSAKSPPTPKDSSKAAPSTTSPPEEYGPPAPPTSSFKSSFQPLVLPTKKVLEPVRPLFDPTFSMLHMDGSILTPKEFRDGVKDAKIKQFKEMVTKAQNAANLINKQHIKDEKGRGRKASSSPSSGRRSRSRSSSRGRRSRSKSRDRRSRSKSRDRRSRSRSRNRRSRSKSRGRRSRSRGRGRYSRSSNSRSRSPRPRYREGYLPQKRYSNFRARGSQSDRYTNPGLWKRHPTGQDRRRRVSRSRSRSYSPRRPPPKRDGGASRPSGKDKSSVGKDQDNRSPKTEMFGKWGKTGENSNQNEKK